ncbi:hydrolase [Bacillus sp. JCM 19046]|nr:hydrolase [Bacillus sp. JCM 19045]GAF19411.1 hydrolase [Bacillus sp. JCM 19046]
MPVYVRYIDLNGCKNSYSIPEKPNGFAIFVLFDLSMLTERESQQLTNHLVEQGYTVFSSSLLQAHWGSPNAVNHAKQLVQLFLKQETVNKRIFLLSEGSGGLIAKRLMEDDEIDIRAASFIKPFFTLESCYKERQLNDLAKKRMEKEVKQAFQLEGKVDLKQLIQLDQSSKRKKKAPVPPMRVFRQLKDGFANVSHLSSTQFVDYYFLTETSLKNELSDQLSFYYQQFHMD